MDINMVTSADPVQSRAQLLHQALKIAKSYVGSAALDGLKRLFWLAMAASLLSRRASE
jgi:hypothetical protein